MELKAIVFDMDGVLVDVSGSYRRAIEETAAQFTGKPVAEGTVQRYKNRGGFNDDWLLTHAIIRDANVDVSFEDVVDAFQERYRGSDWDGFICGEPALIDADTLRLLRERGIQMGVATGRPREEALYTIQRQGWEEFFPVVVAMEDQDGRGKPDPYCLTQTLAGLKGLGLEAEPGQCMYVGDTVDDIRAALAAGFYPTGIVPPYLDAQDHADILRRSGAATVLHRCSELVALVDRLRGDG